MASSRAVHTCPVGPGAVVLQILSSISTPFASRKIRRWPGFSWIRTHNAIAAVSTDWGSHADTLDQRTDGSMSHNRGSGGSQARQSPQYGSRHVPLLECRKGSDSAAQYALITLSEIAQSSQTAITAISMVNSGVIFRFLAQSHDHHQPAHKQQLTNLLTENQPPNQLKLATAGGVAALLAFVQTYLSSGDSATVAAAMKTLCATATPADQAACLKNSGIAVLRDMANTNHHSLDGMLKVQDQVRQILSKLLNVDGAIGKIVEDTQKIATEIQNLQATITNKTTARGRSARLLAVLCVDELAAMHPTTINEECISPLVAAICSGKDGDAITETMPCGRWGICDYISPTKQNNR